MELSSIFASLGLKISDGLVLIAILLQAWILIRVIASEQNTIVWADYISSPVDGKQRGDLSKLGQLSGIVLCMVCTFLYADSDKVEPVGLATVLGVSLTYLGGVQAYSLYQRSKNGISAPPVQSTSKES